MYHGSCGFTLKVGLDPRVKGKEGSSGSFRTLFARVRPNTRWSWVTNKRVNR